VRDTIPVNLICDGRVALVVGYGKVGRRKERFLHASGVAVKVIAPDAAPPEMATGYSQYLKRKFRAGDCRGAFAVFACTDDKHVNRAVLADARKHKVPCCCADQNWADADFTTPAVARVDGAAVAVSTNGASCSSAKELRRSIESFLALRKSCEVAIVGTSDGYTTTGRRSQFHMTAGFRKEMLQLLHDIKGVESLAVLNTCNRVEVALYGSVNMETVKRLMRFHHLSDSEYFVLRGEEAFRHAVMVTAGLKSAWAGEFHVVSQVKDALDESMSLGMLDGRLKGFFDDALHTAKKVRQAVEDMLEVKEIEATAVDYLSGKLDVSKARIVVLGSGKIGSSVAALLKGANVKIIHHGERIPPCDALVCALAAKNPVVKRARKGRIVLDLGMPPNCTPQVGAVSLDDLKNWRRAQTGSLDAALSRAETVIAEEIGKFRT
jgi:siroheme synthase-like protein